MLSRLALTLTTAAVLTVAAAPVARADIGFLVMPGFAGAEIDGDGDATKLELVRAGAVIASSDDGAVTVDGLEAGDVARSYNADGTPHTVMGANASWGSFRQLNPGKDVTYRFTRSGVYPYVCTYHPGMVGAVVVGGGPRMATGASTTASGPVVQVSPQPRIQPAIAAAPAIAPAAVPISAGWIAPWQLIALGVFTLLVLGAVETERRRRRSGAV